MNDQHIKGGFNDLKGKVKEEVGHMAGDESLAGDGVIDQVKGKVQKVVGDVKDAVKAGVDRALNGKNEDRA